MPETYGRIMGTGNHVSPFEHFRNGMNDAGFDFDELDYKMITKIGSLNILWDRLILNNRRGDTYDIFYHPAIEDSPDYISYQLRKAQKNWDNHFERIVSTMNVDSEPTENKDKD